MTSNRTPARTRLLLVLSALVLGAALASAPAAVGAQVVVNPGDAELRNLEHVYNFNFQEHTPLANARSQGSDLDFFSVTVPLRDYETGLLVDEGGVPLPVDAEPVLAERDFAAVGGYSRGGYIFDITDPEDVELAAFVPCPQPRNDPAVKVFTDEDGRERAILALTLQSGVPCGRPLVGAGSGGISVFDVSDPFAWKPVNGIRTGFGGAHNFTFHPTAMVGYVWNGALPGLVTNLPIIDFADVDAPRVLAGPTTEGGPHDGELSSDGTRMYVASENNYRIYDTTDPLDPQLISRTLNLGTYGHGVFASPDGRTMITNNESLALGGFFAAGSGVCPGEGLAFYDIEGDNEQLPIGPLGYYAAEVVGRTPDHRACTSHFGNVGASSVVMTVGWYIAGVRVVDFSNPTLPREIGAAVMPPESSASLGSEVWSARTYRGPYVYTGDLGRGFDVFRWTGNADCPAPWEAGWEPTCEP